MTDVLFEIDSRLRVVADERAAAWVIQTKRRSAPSSSWRNRDYCRHRHWLLECLADHTAAAGIRDLPDLHNLPKRYDGSASLQGRCAR